MDDERLECIARQERFFGRETLPEICLSLRMAVNGAADPWPESIVLAAIEILKDRLELWQPSRPAIAQLFDESVRQMVVATLAEVEYYRRS